MTSGEPGLDNEQDKLTPDLLTICMWSVRLDNTGVRLDNTCDKDDNLSFLTPLRNPNCEILLGMNFLPD